MAVMKWLMHVSILVSGSGGRHKRFFTRSERGVYVWLSSPGKKTLIPMSYLSLEMVCSMCVIVVVSVGFGMNLRPKPRRWWARCGSQLLSVARSWKASFVIGGKKEEG